MRGGGESVESVATGQAENSHSELDATVFVSDNFVASSADATLSAVVDGAEASWATSQSLVERARRGDDGSWTEIVNRYSSLVYCYCRRLGAADDVAADVAQDVLIKVWRGLASFEFRDGQPSFRPWLARVTRNAVFDHWNRWNNTISAEGGSDAVRRLQTVPDSGFGFSRGDLIDVDDQAAEDWLSREELRTAVWTSVAVDFQPRVIEAFCQVVIDKLPVHEVAASLNIKTASVRVYKSRVLNRLHEIADSRINDA